MMRDNSAVLRMGTAKIDITPNKPVPLAGFAHRRSDFISVDRPLYVKIWFFEQRDESNGDIERALLVQADLIWWGTDRVEYLLGQLKERWGLKESSVILHASHTHFGPQTSGSFTPSLGLMDDEYVRMLESNLFNGIEEAFKRMEPVVVERGIGACSIGIHRRKVINNEVLMAPNTEGPHDPEVIVIRFRSESGKTAGVMFHYACHPTTMGENIVTSEFPGVAMELVEQTLGRDTAVSYLQGCCGDIRPALIRGQDFYRGNTEDVWKLGRTLADEVVRVLGQPLELLPPCAISSGRTSVQLPFEQIPSVEMLKEKSIEDGILGEWSRLLLSDSERLEPAALEINCVNLAQGLSFVSFNAEMVVDYGIFIKAVTGRSVIPLAYSNGMIGYVPTAKQLSEGGYEAKDSAYYFGLPSPFDSSVETLIRQTCVELINSIKRI